MNLNLDPAFRVWTPPRLRLWQSRWDRGSYAHLLFDRPIEHGGRQLGTVALTNRPTVAPLTPDWENLAISTPLPSDGLLVMTYPGAFVLVHFDFTPLPPRADLSELTAEQIYSEAVAQGIITPKPSPRPKLKRGNQLRIF